MLQRLITIGLAISLSQCSGTNLFESGTTKTPDEMARIALEKEDWDTAVDLYADLVNNNPEDYWRFPLMASALAGRAGIDILSIAAGILTGGASSNILGEIGKYVPKDPTADELADLASAIARLEAIPAENRAASGPFAYSSEANTQLTIYRGAESSMILNKYQPADAKDSATSSYDRDNLEGMSETEVASIMGNIQGMADDGDESLGPSAQSTLDAINSTPGDTQKEKLLNYLDQTGSK